MINIVSNHAWNSAIGGPAKVFGNLTRGLDKIGYPYVINRDMNATERLWIQDDLEALRYMGESHAHKVVGPNLFVLPRDIPNGTRFDGAVYLQPSIWARDVFVEAGFQACPVEIWPVGIDTDIFTPSDAKPSRLQILIYHKNRAPQELVQIMKAVYDLNLPVTLMIYGRYKEAEYIEAVRKSSLIIWHGTHESQGIALAEALACDVPILVCDATRLSQAYGNYEFPAEVTDWHVTSAPYFDDQCGRKIIDLTQLKTDIESMLDNRERFTPREYILQNLSLECQARAFVGLWERWGLTFEQGLAETAKTTRRWSVSFSVRLRTKIKSLARTSITS